MIQYMRALLAFSVLLWAGVSWASQPPGGDFTLYDVAGKPVSLTSFRGKVVLLYFGFTNCPVMCPTELTVFGSLMKTLPAKDSARVQPIFVSVDPKRDTPDVLKPYTAFFSPSIIALTGSVQQVRHVTDEYHAFFKYVHTGDGYTVDHTVNTFVVDPDGKLVRVIPYGSPVSEYVKTVDRLLH